MAAAYPGISRYPLVMSDIAIENGPVEIVDEFPAIKWWIFPVRYVKVYQRVTATTQ